MKTLFRSFILLLLIQFSGQLFEAKAQNPCGVTNPSTDLPWLANLLSWGCNDPCTGTIYRATYNGQTVFYNLPNNMVCADAMSAILDCSGNMICSFGGFAGGTGSCPNFFETVINQEQLCSISGGCDAPDPTVVLPTNHLCISGEVLPPIIEANVTPLALPLIYALGLFVVDEAGNIVVPIYSGSYSVNLTGLPAGTYYVRAIVYLFSDPPNLAATTMTALETSGGCFKLSPITPINTILLGNQIPHAIMTTAPNCNDDGTYSVGITVYGSSGSASLSQSGTILQEGIETFVTFNSPYYDLHVSDVQTGCAEDFIELFGPVNCSSCYDASHDDPNMACIEIYDPVCGCNGQTYSNWCYAYYNGITAWTNGACGNEYFYNYTLCAGDSLNIGMEGWVGNVTYDWTPTSDIVGCADNCGSNCNTCFNINVAPTTTTTYTLHTFYTLGMEHSYHHYTITVLDCSAGCIDTSLINPNMGCPDVWLPVCGCNFVTYGNECDAVNYGGVTSFYGGQCGEQQSLTICEGDSIQIGIPWMFETFFEWTPTENLTCIDSGCNYAWVSPEASTRYVLRAYSPMPGNFGTVYFFDVNVEVCNGIANPTSNNSLLKISPNPTTNQQTTVLYEGKDPILLLTLYNTIGQQVRQIDKPMFIDGKYALELNNLPNGMYYLKIQTNKGQILAQPLVK